MENYLFNYADAKSQILDRQAKKLAIDTTQRDNELRELGIMSAALQGVETPEELEVRKQAAVQMGVATPEQVAPLTFEALPALRQAMIGHEGLFREKQFEQGVEQWNKGFAMRRAEFGQRAEQYAGNQALRREEMAAVQGRHDDTTSLARARFDFDRRSEAEARLIERNERLRAEGASKRYIDTITRLTRPADLEGAGFDERSVENLSQVDPNLASLLAEVRRRTGVVFEVHEGHRSAERQAELRKKGKSWVDRSKHQDRMAADIHLKNPDGSANWTTEDYDEVGAAFKEIAKEMGLKVRWGGDWGVKDAVHFELVTGKPSRDEVLALAGDPDTTPEQAKILRESLEGGPVTKESAPEAKIRRLTELGIDEETATLIVDGVIGVSQNPETGAVVLYNKAEKTATPVRMPPEDAGGPDGVAAGEDDGFGSIDMSQNFGLFGAGRSLFNTIFDSVSADLPFEQVEKAKAHLEVIGSSMTRDTMMAYRRQPPAFIIKEIKALFPEDGVIRVGRQRALGKSEAILDQLRRDKAVLEDMMKIPMKPKEARELQERMFALNSAMRTMEMVRRGIAGEEKAAVEAPAEKVAEPPVEPPVETPEAEPVDYGVFGAFGSDAPLADDEEAIAVIADASRHIVEMNAKAMPAGSNRSVMKMRIRKIFPEDGRMKITTDQALEQIRELSRRYINNYQKLKKKVDAAKDQNYITNGRKRLSAMQSVIDMLQEATELAKPLRDAAPAGELARPSIIDEEDWNAMTPEDRQEMLDEIEEAGLND